MTVKTKNYFDVHPEPFGTIMSYLSGNHPEWYVSIEYGEGGVIIYQADADKLEHIGDGAYWIYILGPEDYTGISARDTILLANKIQEYFEEEVP